MLTAFIAATRRRATADAVAREHARLLVDRVCLLRRTAELGRELALAESRGACRCADLDRAEVAALDRWLTKDGPLWASLRGVRDVVAVLVRDDHGAWHVDVREWVADTPTRIGVSINVTEIPELVRALVAANELHHARLEDRSNADHERRDREVGRLLEKLVGPAMPWTEA